MQNQLVRQSRNPSWFYGLHFRTLWSRPISRPRITNRRRVRAIRASLRKTGKRIQTTFIDCNSILFSVKKEKEKSISDFWETNKIIHVESRLVASIGVVFMWKRRYKTAVTWPRAFSWFRQKRCLLSLCSIREKRTKTNHNITTNTGRFQRKHHTNNNNIGGAERTWKGTARKRETGVRSVSSPARVFCL